MSNKISNSVTFKCDTNRLNEILEAIQYTCDDNPEEYGIGTINFNKICPMPDSLNIEHGSRTWDAAKYYLTLINPCTPFLDVEKLSLDAFSNLYKQLPSHLLYGLASVDIVQLEERWSKEFLLERGRQAIENVQKYGADTWYEWRYEHWGTKWNAHNCYYDGFNTIHFQTANGAPFEVTQALSRRFPDVTMIHSWYGDYYTYCPDCGIPINFENDGLNGFCVKCADKH